MAALVRFGMDNQQIDITSEGRNGIDLALQIIWNAAVPGGKASHYKVMRLKSETTYHQHEAHNGRAAFISHHERLKEHPEGYETLILLWHDEAGAIPLPFKLDCKQSGQFVADWLGSLDYGHQPDHDGSNGKGWRLFTESWGHVVGHHYAIVGVQPQWAMYGK